ncbi:Beta/alpha-amylase precursor [compost metagenome]
MEASEIAGFSKITVHVDSSNGVEAVFNNGSGVWDNNGGKNYRFPLNTSTFRNGVITEGAPEISNNEVTIYYKHGYEQPYIHYRIVGGAWTIVPGVAMEASEIAGYSKITIQTGDSTGVEAVFNNGSGTWDNNGGRNYHFPLGSSTYNNGIITEGSPNNFF